MCQTALSAPHARCPNKNRAIAIATTVADEACQGALTPRHSITVRIPSRCDAPSPKGLTPMLRMEQSRGRLRRQRSWPRLTRMPICSHWPLFVGRRSPFATPKLIRACRRAEEPKDAIDGPAPSDSVSELGVSSRCPIVGMSVVQSAQKRVLLGDRLRKAKKRQTAVPNLLQGMKSRRLSDW
jgi:hypothetical protein